MVVANDLNGILVPQWDDLQAPATAINPPGQVSDPTWDVTNGGWLFDSGSTEMLYIIQQFKHSYKEGSYIIPHIHWEPTNTDDGDVKWRIEYKWKNNNESDPDWTTLDMIVPANGEAYRPQKDDFANVLGTGKQISSMMTIKLSRIGGDDDYAGNALFKEFDIHYQMDTRGSVQASSKL